MFGDGFLHGLQHGTRLDDSGTAHLVDFENAVHLLGGQDDVIAVGFYRAHAVREPTLRYDGLARCVAMLEYTGDFIGGGRQHQGLRLHRRAVPVAGRATGNRLRVQQTAVANDIVQCGNGARHARTPVTRPCIEHDIIIDSVAVHHATLMAAHAC